MNENLISSKFIMSCAILLLSYALVFVGKLDAKSWFEWATAVVGVYATANVVQKFS